MFVGREKELSLLKNLICSNTAKIGVIYGRRRIGKSGAFYSWLGRSFEYLCLDHAGSISKELGFSGVGFTFGPYFVSHSANSKGVQIDLLFNRKDNVITLCEMKYSNQPVGTSIIGEVNKKVSFLQSNPKMRHKTIQKVLISNNGATKDLVSSGFFYKILTPDFFISR